ncbi:MAG TPA: lysophospholipid acyltransferase family protein [Micromonosporaceae bacterium]|nr:lysophospholipid acyltransferase family protein [Micromonosporaceae bacterium]
MSTLYTVGKLTAAPLMRLAWRPTVTGLEHVPRSGPAILASNHLSMVDSPLLGAICPRPLYFLAKNDYFVRPGLFGAAMRTVLEGLNQIPVDRSGGRASLLALDAAVPVLRAGNALGIHPEGTRSPDGRLYRGRPGVARLALDTDATIVPIGLIGTERIHPIGARLPRLGRVEVRIGPPLDLSPWQGQPVTSKVLREVTDRLMREIQKLTEQEYVVRYARRSE